MQNPTRFVPGKTTYQAAQAVAATIETHFAQHLSDARERQENQLAPAPEAPEIEAIIDTAFWASLRREEGISPKISLAFLSPEHTSQPLLFEHKLTFAPHLLAKLAPAVERPGIHLGVWLEGGDFYIWGTTRELPAYCFVLEVVEPGLLVVKHSRQDGYGKFVNVAVLKGDEIKLIDEDSAGLPDCPDILSSLLGFTAPATWNHSVNVLVQLAASMRAHGRGGALLVVPDHSQTWRNSIIHPISYSVAPSFCELADLMVKDEAEKSKNTWLNALNRAVDGVAGLTAVDGATIISENYALLAFGAKIKRAEGSPSVERIIITEPILNNQPRILPPGQNGGTRHLSAAQFVHDQRDSIALVSSQDGRFTIFTWSPCEGMVHAHLVDSLLL